jgi:hypothetical protein
MPTYERYPGEPAAKAKARIARNVAKKKGKKKKAPKKEVAAVLSRQGRPRRRPHRKKVPRRMYV